MSVRRGCPARRALVLAVCASVPAAGCHAQVDRRHEGPRSGPPIRTVELGPMPRAVPESSGLAVSRAYPGTFWTHNDSGDDPVLYALDGSARLVAAHPIAGARARDWEDLAIGPCPGAGDTHCLYIADTGDNGRRRRTVRVYVVPEPEPSRASSETRVIGWVELTYDAGPLDVEALAVAPSGDLVLVSKGREGRILGYEVEAGTVVEAVCATGSPTPTVEGSVATSPGTAPSGSGAAVAGYSARCEGRSGSSPEPGAATNGPLVLSDPVLFPILPDFAAGRWVTGGAITPDGSTLAVRTYADLYFYRLPLERPPVTTAPPCSLAGLEPVGEAVAFSPEGRIYLTSESPGNRVGRLREIECAGHPGGRGGVAPVR